MLSMYKGVGAHIFLFVILRYYELTSKRVSKAASKYRLKEYSEATVSVRLQRLHQVAHRQREHDAVHRVRYTLNIGKDISIFFTFLKCYSTLRKEKI